MDVRVPAVPGSGGAAEEPDVYCRQVEAYLCRKNDGHLVRIVGPAFEQVRGWAAQGIPLRTVFQGIDRYFERYYAKGPRRRPVRIEFCEADVLDVFDEWRRAVGITRTAEAIDEADAPARGSLPAHLDRALARLTAARSSATPLDEVVAEIVRELDAARSHAKSVRGEARESLVARLEELDARLLAAARSECDAATLDRMNAEADAELAPFRGRMEPAALDRSREACVTRLVREHFRLPDLAFR